MSAARHVYEIFIRAAVAQVWEAITDPSFTRRYFHRTAVASAFEPGGPIRYLTPSDDVAIEGTVEVVEPGRRLVMTWRALYDADLAAEPPSRVEWELTPCDPDEGITRVTLRHGDLGLSPATWASVRLGWQVVLDGMKTLLETGEELGAIDLGAPAPPAEVAQDWHRQLGVEAHNAAWELLDGRTLDADAADELLGRVYASLYHWRRATGPGAIQRARANYMCGRAHLALGDGEVATRHAERCVALTAAAGDGAADFDHAYALELQARALASLGHREQATELRRRALAVEIADPEDRALVDADLAAEPWYGI